MLTLYTFGPEFGLPDPSAFRMKAASQHTNLVGYYERGLAEWFPDFGG